MTAAFIPDDWRSSVPCRNAGGPCSSPYPSSQWRGLHWTGCTAGEQDCQLVGVGTIIANTGFLSALIDQGNLLGELDLWQVVKNRQTAALLPALSHRYRQRLPDCPHDTLIDG